MCCYLKNQKIGIFGEDAFYENTFGTVGIKTHSESDDVRVVEATTFRTESVYEDFRRPKEISFSKKLEDDVSRRDFTVNALALDQDGNIIDYFKGGDDLRHKIIRCVGSPLDRFQEDALRMMRAVRLAVELEFSIEDTTMQAICEHAHLLQFISKERVRDEFMRIVMSDHAAFGIEMLRRTGLLIEIMPELVQGYEVMQNKHHTFDVYTHAIRCLDYAAQKKYSLQLRLAALLHDVGKPLTKQGEGPDATFYGHELLGAKLTKHMLSKLKFPNKIIRDAVHLVRYHMFYLEIEEVTMSAVRRFVRKVGEESLQDLFLLREADRIGSGVPKAVPYRLRYLKYLVKKSHLKEIKPDMLALNGNELMEQLQIIPGPKVGWILKALLQEVIENPKKNKKDYLAKRAGELFILSDEKLKDLAVFSDEKTKELEEEQNKELKKEFYVE